MKTAKFAAFVLGLLMLLVNGGRAQGERGLPRGTVFIQADTYFTMTIARVESYSAR